MRDFVKSEFVASLSFVKHMITSFPIGLLLDAHIYGDIRILNIEIASFIHDLIFEKKPQDINLKLPSSVDYVHELLEDVTKGGMISPLFKLVPGYAVIVNQISPNIDIMEQLLNDFIGIPIITFPKKSYIGSMVKLFNQVNLESHVIESFLEPYWDILLMGKEKALCLNQVELEKAMAARILQELTKFIINIPSNTIEFTYNSYQEVIENEYSSNKTLPQNYPNAEHSNQLEINFEEGCINSTIF